MSQSAPIIALSGNPAPPGAASNLPGGPYPIATQLAALQRLHEHAQRRRTLAQKLFTAAQEQTAEHQSTLAHIRAEQAEIHQLLEHDRTADPERDYDPRAQQCVDQALERLTALDKRLADFQTNWAMTQRGVQDLLQRAQTVLDQAVRLGDLTLQLRRHMEVQQEQQVRQAAAPASTPPAGVSATPVPAPSQEPAISFVKLLETYHQPPAAPDAQPNDAPAKEAA